MFPACTFNCWKLRNTGGINVLMSFSGDYNICISSGSFANDRCVSALWVIPPASLDTSRSLMERHALWDVALLETGQLCVPVNAELRSWM